MAGIAEIFHDYLMGVKFATPRFGDLKCDSTTLGSADIAEKLVQQLTQPVRWQSSIQFIYRHGPMLFIEPGAKTVLSKPMPSLLVHCSSYEITL
ncbi:hypothetical protein [Photorhabdus cinerea]|uniref:Uncharacterized protein n=1 Tax=Photorhabdus cinerea TaxID=471575 RepID=A0A7X5QD30_9GAMM|nr:hypothetical protein [Photorhabdus cinerea]NHB92121.1 hypothetical protein [Photorhabdus cinerea]